MPPTPRWVKVFGVIVLLALLVLVGVLLFGGGAHGPQRHTFVPAAPAAVFRAP